jgi:tetratricopeptide (TPR) repeat protein
MPHSNRKVFPGCLGVFLLLSSMPAQPSFAHLVPDGPAPSRPDAALFQGASAHDDEFERLRREGSDAVFNLDFTTARDRFQTMAGLSPDAPAPFVYLASCIWLETLKKARRLSLSLFSSAHFYEQKSDSDKPDPARDQMFNELIDRAIAASSALLNKNPRDAEALYYQAGALGIRAAYLGTVERNFKRAISDANKAAEIESKVLKIDPQYYDAYLSIGLYEYIIGSLPFFWRLLARLAGLGGGSKERGIQHLETVISKGRLACDDARLFLLAIYNREGKMDKSLELIEYLLAKYARNYLLAVEHGRLLYEKGNPAEGERVFETLLRDPRTAAEAADVVN